MDDASRWNHNIHYHRILLAAVPNGARTALDVGCGEGMLTRRLARHVPHVVGIDRDEVSVSTARATTPDGSIDYVLGDVLTHPFPPGSFDVVVSVATLHHLDARAGLTRLAGLLAPGGTLAVIGLARSSGIADLAYDLGGAVAHRVLVRRHSYWEHPSPMVWPPPLTYRELRDLSTEVLPGSHLRRLLLWRYSLVWVKPGELY